MIFRLATATALGALLIGSGAARADDALTTLQAMHMTPPVDWPTVPQEGPKADAVKKILKEKIKLPPGFHIDLYALVPDARHMAVGPQGIVTFVGTRKSKIWADRSLTQRRGGGSEGIRAVAAEEVTERSVLLPRRLPVCRRAEPHSAVPSRGVLL